MMARQAADRDYVADHYMAHIMDSPGTAYDMVNVSALAQYRWVHHPTWVVHRLKQLLDLLAQTYHDWELTHYLTLCLLVLR